MLALPADVLGEQVAANPEATVQTSPVSGPDPEQVRAVVRMLGAARRPVVVAGGGARGAREALVSFAETFGAGVYASFRRQDVFPNDHPNFLGHLALGTPPEILRALEEADLVLVVGCRLSEVTTQSYSLPRGDQTVIQVDVDPGEVGATVPVEIGMVSDARSALAAFDAQASPERAMRDWTEAHGAYLDSSTVPPARDAEGIDPSQVVKAMRQTLPADTLLANDAGNFSVFVHRYWRYNHPDTQLASTNGAMGYGVPAAVAAKLAAPGRTVVACCGDGGFLMTGQEMETAVRYGVPVTVIVFRNGLQGTIAMHQQRDLGRTAGVDIGAVDLAGYARSLGAEGYTVRDPEELAPALQAASSSDAVSLVDVVTAPDLINPTSRLSELAADTTRIN
jgi:acetolactate synthase-1/2/3 large subunit